MARHVLPNALGPIIVQATFLIPQAILFEAFLSFLGLRPAVARTLLGGDVIERVFNDRFLAYHTMIVPSLALLVTLIAVNFIGDGLRDALDPRLNR